eukprot:s561_g15.t1
MPELFTSHSWCLDLPLVISISALVFGAAQSSPYSDISDTYNQALWWGAAHPGDPPGTNGCFSSNRTFEHCCVSWTGEPGELPRCWENQGAEGMEGTEGSQLTYDACCVAKHHWAPRSFSCDGKGIYWQRLYQTLALFRVFTELNETPLNQASPHECLVGGVLASILSLIHIGYDRQYRTQEQKDMDYERAEGLLLVLFSSPVTLEEVLVSGWPLFLSLDLFRADDGFLQMARQRLPLQAPGEHTLKWSEVVVKNSITKSGDIALAQLVPILTSLVEYHNLRNFQLPRADQGEMIALAMEAKRLITFVDTQLRQWMIAVKRSVVACSCTDRSRKSPADQRPLSWGSAFEESAILQGFDAASNMVRATAQPMCYQEGFLQLILSMASMASSVSRGRSLRLWDVGASYGDCLLWAAAVLDHLKDLELRGFEPLPAQALAFRQSAQVARAQVKVENMALRDERGTLDIGFPSHSMALATFQSCRKQYEVPSNNEYQCISRTTTSETLDEYLRRLAPLEPVDLLKVHVQGDELSVLHGANASFTSGRICGLHLNLEHFYLIPGAARMISNLLRRSGFIGVLVNLWDVRPVNFLNLKSAMVRRQPFWRRGQRPAPEDMTHELLAWSTTEGCRESLVAQADEQAQEIDSLQEQLQSGSEILRKETEDAACIRSASRATTAPTSRDQLDAEGPWAALTGDGWRQKPSMTLLEERSTRQLEEEGDLTWWIDVDRGVKVRHAALQSEAQISRRGKEAEAQKELEEQRSLEAELQSELRAAEVELAKIAEEANNKIEAANLRIRSLRREREEANNALEERRQGNQKLQAMLEEIEQEKSQLMEQKEALIRIVEDLHSSCTQAGLPATDRASIDSITGFKMPS